ncbi:MAG: 6,7-dimethyl-8-ribityllumazine synthase [Candidatus Velthaea sp.]
MTRRTKGASAARLPDGRGKRFAVVSARFYIQLAEWLEDGARRGLRECGVADNRVDVFTVPGCFEIPLAASRLINGGDYDGIVALGVVVRGDTPHFDFVAGECARGIMSVQLSTGIPIGFGILTTENLAQAEERADPARLDKGYEAAVAAVTIAALDPGLAKPRVGFR